MRRPFTINLGENEVALISEDEGVFVVEPMRFLRLGAARAQAKREAEQERRHTGRVNVLRGQGQTRT